MDKGESGENNLSLDLDYLKYMECVKKRRAEIVRLRKNNWTLKQIGEKMEITAERVRQILLAEEAKKLSSKPKEVKAKPKAVYEHS